MWDLFKSKSQKSKGPANKRLRNRRVTAQKAVLVCKERVVYRILDMSSRGARLSGPKISDVLPSWKTNDIIEFLIHYGGAQYKRVRGLIRWSEPKNKTFGIEFVE